MAFPCKVSLCLFNFVFHVRATEQSQFLRLFLPMGPAFGFSFVAPTNPYFLSSNGKPHAFKNLRPPYEDSAVFI